MMFSIGNLYHLSYSGIFSFSNRLLSTAYKSSISLCKLHPNSSLNITSHVEVPVDPSCKFSGFIPIDKLKITYSRSSAPGGQHVNVVNTKVDIRFHVESAEWLDLNIRKKITELYKKRINKDGYLIVRSERTRSQIYNQADAMTTLRNMIRTAAVSLEPSNITPQETSLQIRKRQEKANIERLFKKRFRSETKNARRDSFEL